MTTGAPAKLWDKGEPLDALIERFTVGNDPQLDAFLVPHDALASAAHATMLARIGVLDEHDLPALLAELRAIASEARAGTFVIARSQEDGHTAIEQRLTAKLGELGQRIHTGRSRNDQVIAALRLFGRTELLRMLDGLLEVCATLREMADEHAATVIPGYSHTRQAMPTTVGHYLAAHLDGLLASVPWIETAFNHLNRSPLGSASGFGTALPIDREFVAELLAFDSVQVNTLAVQNDRGKTEFLVLSALAAPLADLGRLAADVIWLSSDELKCLHLANETTTGSSIMPQKRNPDVWELIRAGAAQHRARLLEVGSIYGQVGAGYHRDLQLTKEPFVTAMLRARDTVAVTVPALRGISVDVARCADLLERSTAATDEVYRRVASGVPFRVAYRDVAADPVGAVTIDPTESWKLRTHLGAPGGFSLEQYDSALDGARSWLDAMRSRVGGRLGFDDMTRGG